MNDLVSVLVYFNTTEILIVFTMGFLICFTANSQSDTLQLQVWPQSWPRSCWMVSMGSWCRAMGSRMWPLETPPAKPINQRERPQRAPRKRWKYTPSNRFLFFLLLFQNYRFAGGVSCWESVQVLDGRWIPRLPGRIKPAKLERKVVCVRAEDINISGSLYRNKLKYANFRRKHMRLGCIYTATEHQPNTHSSIRLEVFFLWTLTPAPRNTNPRQGPFHYRSPAKILWRTIRGMARLSDLPKWGQLGRGGRAAKVPHKTARGAAALDK